MREERKCWKVRKESSTQITRMGEEGKKDREGSGKK